MTEKQLIDLGFEKQELDGFVPEIGNEDYYYSLDIGDICLLSSCLSDGNDWYVEIFDFESYRSYDAKGVGELIRLLKLGFVDKLK